MCLFVHIVFVFVVSSTMFSVFVDDGLVFVLSMCIKCICLLRFLFVFICLLVRACDLDVILEAGIVLFLDRCCLCRCRCLVSLYC